MEGLRLKTSTFLHCRAYLQLFISKLLPKNSWQCLIHSMWCVVDNVSYTGIANKVHGCTNKIFRL